MSIQIEDVSYIYLEGTPFQQMALNNVSLTIGDTQIVGIMGKTGSGKSTLLQLLNGLLKPGPETHDICCRHTQLLALS
jgi:energy-coupling factor transport system ATP-binding protein